MSGWGVRWNPWSNAYSSLECEQMRFLHKSYCEAMEVGEEDLPTILRMDESFQNAKHSPNVSDFDEHTFMRKMQNVVGLLRNPAESIISCICAYQKDRHDRIAFHGYLNDPRTLLLEELKDWAMRSLAPSSCTTESILNEVRQRHSYIVRLQHGQQGLFQSGSNERSLLSTLKDVRYIIETRVLPIIESERVHSSAREQLHTLEARGIDGLIHGVQYLFYVLRNTANVPEDCSIGNLQRQQHSGMKEAMQSKSGQMMQLLLDTPSFQALFPEGGRSNFHGENPKLLDSDEDVCFNSRDAKGSIPSCLIKKSKKKSDDPVKFLTSSNSGLVPLQSSEDSAEAYDMFTRLHGMLKILADLLLSCRKARQLAGPGGDLLVYGPGGEEVRRLMKSCESVQREIVMLVNGLTRIGVKQLDRLKSSQEKSWRNSFRKVLPLENYIAHDFEACVEPIQRITASADPKHVRDMLRRFRQATGQWAQENFTICKQVNLALGLPIETTPQHGFPRLKNNLTKEENTNNQIMDLHNATGQFIEENAEKKTSNGGRVEAISDQKGLTHSVSLGSASDSSDDDNKIENHPKAGLSTLQTAASLVSWAVGGGGGVSTTNVHSSGSNSGPPKSHSSTTSPSNSKTPRSNTSVTDTDDEKNGSGVGIFDVLLLVRQAIQRVSQLAWGVRSSLRTCDLAEEDEDSFIMLCAIYEAVGIECSEGLFCSMKQHQSRMIHLFSMYLSCSLRMLYILQRRILDEEKCLTGMLFASRRLGVVLETFHEQLVVLAQQQDDVVRNCHLMKDGVCEMPDLELKSNVEGASVLGPALLALDSIYTTATSIGQSTGRSAAILSHGQYMKQICSQLDLHQNSIFHLLDSLSGVQTAFQLANDRLEECAKTHDSYIPPQQIDYIFEYNFDGFFKQATNDLQVLVGEIEKLY